MPSRRDYDFSHGNHEIVRLTTEAEMMHSVRAEWREKQKLVSLLMPRRETGALPDRGLQFRLQAFERRYLECSTVDCDQTLGLETAEVA